MVYYPGLSCKMIYNDYGESTSMSDFYLERSGELSCFVRREE